MGKNGRYFLALLAGLMLSGCAVDPERAAKFDPGIDRICAWTGLQRSGPIRKITQWKSDPGHMVEVSLKVDGKARRFEFVFQPDGELTGFAPDPLSFIDLDKGLGEDDDIDPATRARCLDVVRNFNRKFKAPLHGPGTILRWHGTYLVTFETIPEAEWKALLAKKQVILDPYVTFLVTPKGTVYGVFWGC